MGVDGAGARRPAEAPGSAAAGAADPPGPSAGRPLLARASPGPTPAGARPPCPRSPACLLAPPSPGGTPALEARGGARWGGSSAPGVRVPVGVAGCRCDRGGWFGARLGRDPWWPAARAGQGEAWAGSPRARGRPGGRTVAAVLVSIVVSIPACHAGDRGSIPRRGGNTPFLVAAVAVCPAARPPRALRPLPPSLGEAPGPPTAVPGLAPVDPLCPSSAPARALCRRRAHGRHGGARASLATPRPCPTIAGSGGPATRPRTDPQWLPEWARRLATATPRGSSRRRDACRQVGPVSPCRRGKWPRPAPGGVGLWPAGCWKLRAPRCPPGVRAEALAGRGGERRAGGPQGGGGAALGRWGRWIPATA